MRITWTIILATIFVSVPAQAWKVLDEFQLVKGKHAFAQQMIQDSKSILYAVGGAKESENYPWFAPLVRRSKDQGKSWSTFRLPSVILYATAIAVDKKDNLYVGGAGLQSWNVVKSVDQGQTWEVVDAVSGVSGEIKKIGISPSGIVYAAGVTKCGPKCIQWIVRRSSAKNSWETVDVFKIPGATEISSPSDIAFTEDGRVLVIGDAYDDGANRLHWIVRMAPDGGVSWQTVDDFVSASGAVGMSILRNSQGDLYAAGYTYGDQNDFVGLVRISKDGGINWSTLSEFKGLYWTKLVLAGNRMLAVGKNLNGSFIYQSEDSAKSFENVNFPKEYSILDLYFGTSQIVWWAGQSKGKPEKWAVGQQ